MRHCLCSDSWESFIRIWSDSLWTNNDSFQQLKTWQQDQSVTELLSSPGSNNFCLNISKKDWSCEETMNYSGLKNVGQSKYKSVMHGHHQYEWEEGVGKWKLTPNKYLHIYSLAARWLKTNQQKFPVLDWILWMWQDDVVQSEVEFSGCFHH